MLDYLLQRYHEDLKDYEDFLDKLVEEAEQTGHVDEYLKAYKRMRENPERYPKHVKCAILIGCLLRYKYGDKSITEKNDFYEVKVNRYEIPLGAVNVEGGKVTVNFKLFASFLARKYCIVYYSGVFYCWNGKRFVDNDRLISTIIQNHLYAAGFPGWKRATYYIAEIKAILKNMCAIAEFPFNGTQGFIPVNNGVIWVEKNELLPHSPVFGFLYNLPIDYDPEAECPLINKFLKSLVRDEQSLEILYEIPAACLTRHNYQFAYFLYGTGSNGKSTYLNLIERFLGKENVSHVSLQDLCTSRFRAAQLIGKLANIFPDLPSMRIDNSGIFKALTGEDTITIERKFKDPFDFTNTARLIFSANEFPKIKDETDAFWRRWIIVKFPFKFRQKPKLLDEILTPEELSGFLNEVLKRLPRVLACEPTIVEDAKKEWIRNSDSLRAFEMDCVRKTGEEDYVEKEEAYQYYCEYCEDRGVKPVSYNTFCRFMVRVAKTKRVRIRGEVKRVFSGIRLVEPETEQETDAESEHKSEIKPECEINSLNMVFEEEEKEKPDTEKTDTAKDEREIKNTDEIRYVAIEVLKLPVGNDEIKIMGVDGIVYTLKEGKRLALPEENAKVLLEKGYAMKIGHEGNL